MSGRHFTVDEANVALERVRPLAERMVELHGVLAASAGRHAGAAAAISGNGGGAGLAHAAEREVARAREELAAVVRELHELGVQVKDVATGLLDFPALRGGEEVLLCWRVGEDGVRYWHGLDDGFAGRQPL